MHVAQEAMGRICHTGVIQSGSGWAIPEIAEDVRKRCSDRAEDLSPIVDYRFSNSLNL